MFSAWEAGSNVHRRLEFSRLGKMGKLYAVSTAKFRLRSTRLAVVMGSNR